SEFKEMLKTYSREQSGKDELIKYLLDSKAIEASKRVSNEFLDNALVNIIEIDEPIKQYLIEMVEKLRTRLN
ncbi:polyprenyl synthetase family protein, partial [Haloferula chungangensis]